MKKIKKLLDEACIDYITQGPAIMLDTAPVTLLNMQSGLLIFGAGYSGVWPYSAEYVVKMLDKKFREGAL